MANPQESYRALLGKIAALGAQQNALFGEQIRCRRGCYECCRPPDSLFRVEAEALLHSVAALPAHELALVKTQLQAYEARQRDLCPLLNEAEEGRCMAYDGRPSICRTQGYALWLRGETDTAEESAEGTMSWCELNFTEVTPQRPDAFDVERLNMMLSLITQLGWPHGSARMGLVPLLTAALNASVSVQPDAEASVQPDAEASVQPDAEASVQPDAEASVQIDAEASVLLSDDI